MASSKKTFKATAATGLQTLIPSRPAEIDERQLKEAARQWKAAGRVGRPRRADKDNTKVPAAERGTKPGEARKTYLVNIEQAAELDRIAYMQRKKVKECLAEALQAYIDRNKTKG